MLKSPSSLQLPPKPYFVHSYIVFDRSLCYYLTHSFIHTLHSLLFAHSSDHWFPSSFIHSGRSYVYSVHPLLPFLRRVHYPVFMTSRTSCISSGTLLPFDAAPPAESALYHHGEEESRAGYTVDDMFRLTRSAVQQQRVLGLQTISNLLIKVLIKVLPESGHWGLAECEARFWPGWVRGRWC